MMMFEGSNDDDLGKSGTVQTKDIDLFKFGVALEGAQAVTDLKDQYNLIESLSVTVDKSMRGLINTMGQGEKFSAGIRRNIADAIPAVIEMGGAVEDVTRINADYTQALGRNVTLTNEQTEGLFAAEKISGKTSKELVDGFANVGMSIKDIGVNMLAVREVANNLGANAIAVSREVVGNIQQLNRFNFKDGVEGLARMAAQSSALRVSMQSVFTLAEKVLDPEKAIEMSSALQRLGASSSALTDPLRLMDLAQNNVPQLQQELGKMFKQYTMFDEKTKSFKIMPGARLQLRAIADEMGIGIDEAEKYALGAADLGKKLSQISFAGLDVDDDLKTTIANMATMGEGGEYMIKTETGEEMVLQDFLDKYKGDEKGLKEYLDRQQKEEGKSYEDKMLEAQQTMAELAKRQLDEYTKAEKLGEAAKFAAPSSAAGSQYAKELLGLNVQLAEKINKPIIENFGPESELRKSFDAAGKGLGKAVEAIESGNYKKGLEIVAEQTASLGLDIVGQIKETLNDFGDIPGIDVLKDKVATGIDELSKTIEEKFPDLSKKIEELKKEIEGWKLPKPNEQEQKEEGKKGEIPTEQKEEGKKGEIPTEQKEEGKKGEIPTEQKEEGKKGEIPTSQLNQSSGINVPTNVGTAQIGIQLPDNTTINTEQLSVTTNNLNNVSALENKEVTENTTQISPLTKIEEVFDQYMALLKGGVGQSITTITENTGVSADNSVKNSLLQLQTDLGTQITNISDGVKQSLQQFSEQTTIANNTTNTQINNTAQNLENQTTQNTGLTTENTNQQNLQTTTLNIPTANISTNQTTLTSSQIFAQNLPNTTEQTGIVNENISVTSLADSITQLSSILSQKSEPVEGQTVTLNAQTVNVQSTTPTNQENLNVVEGNIFKFSEATASLVQEMQNFNQSISQFYTNVVNKVDIGGNLNQLTQNLEQQRLDINNLNETATNFSNNATTALNTQNENNQSLNQSITSFSDQSVSAINTQNQNNQNLNDSVNNFANKSTTSFNYGGNKNYNTEKYGELNNFSNEYTTDITNETNPTQNELYQNQTLITANKNLENFAQTNISQGNTPTQNQLQTNTIEQVPLKISEIQAPISVSNFAELKGEMVYGGEIKVTHTPMEIVVSSKDGKMDGKEIGDALTEELGRSNKLQNSLKKALGDADLSTVSKPPKIRDSQFLDKFFG